MDMLAELMVHSGQVAEADDVGRDDAFLRTEYCGRKRRQAIQAFLADLGSRHGPVDNAR
jgi:hypothetical protein